MNNNLQTPCKQNNCYAYATHKGYCKHHQKIGWKNNRTKNLPPDWSTRRATILKRDNYICYICNQKGADSVDHIQAGNNHDYDNLKACHQNVKPYCHRKKSSREANQRQGHNTNPKPKAKTTPETIQWNL